MPCCCFALESGEGGFSGAPGKQASSVTGSRLLGYLPNKRRSVKISRKITAAAAVVTAPVEEEVREFTLPTWAEFEFGRAPVYWKTMNGLPPTSGERLRIFYNPAAAKLVPNEEFGIGFNAVNLIFSFTNGNEWDGPYKMQFQVLKPWQNKPITFFNEGLAEELSKEGACDRAIFPDSSIVATRCALMGNLTIEGGDRCNLDFVPGCTDPSSSEYNPFANVDDGSCPIELNSEE
ncbi:hypothetical protein RHGRI_035200 [Rhododendron griersonianum]|uniref:PIFI-like Ig-like domain-containing protein n=1 Tax=Rhododendron griersonianum TaxID=479676 RepID=A0AAV6I9M6_9ERIC|nr:hypothetical protein RHGRI_035200 [Rhododendron griersonianum]